MLANLIIDTFHRGGWVMWPIAAISFLAWCVVLDRAHWWWRHRASLDPDRREQAIRALREGDLGAARKLAETSSDPFLIPLRQAHRHGAARLPAAMRLDASRLVEESQARMWVMATLITLAPLLGLFGTVAGLMASFAALGESRLAVVKITGGIGEALIATACGIAIAVGSLLPYNFFRKRATGLRNALERWIGRAELQLKHARTAAGTRPPPP